MKYNLFDSPSIPDELNFKKLKDYLNIDIPDIDNIFIKGGTLPQFDPLDKILSVKEILQISVKSLLKENKENVLTNGFEESMNKGPSFVRNCINSTTNLFRRKHWSSVFKLLGGKGSIFLLTKCIIIEKINDNFVLLAGNPMALTCGYKTKNNFFPIEPLYKKVYKIKKLELKKIILFVNPKNEFVTKHLQKIVQKFNKIDISAIFNQNFPIDTEGNFVCKEKQIDRKRIVDFLFLISKKFLKESFSFFSFRILKSKINLLLMKKKVDFFTKIEFLKYFKFNDPIIKEIKEIKGKRIIFERILLFLFENVYFPLVTSYFYCTKTTFSKYELCFFIRKEWDFYSANAISSFLKDHDEMGERKKYTYPYKIKVIPKEKGFRVIINMKNTKKIKHLETYLSGILNYKLNNSVIGLNNASIKLKEAFEQKKEYFILKLDLKDCFNNIPHSKLMDCLNYYLNKEESLCVQGYNVIENRKGIIYKKQIIKCFYKRFSFFEIIKKEKTKKNQLIYENSSFYEITNENLLKEIQKSIFNYQIIYKNKIYKPKKGIPQGNVLSPIICCIYLSYLDDLFFNTLLKDGKILRYMDDFLILGTNKSGVELFYKGLLKLEEYGIKVNQEKIENNFDFLEKKKNNFIKWAGHKIISDDFSIKYFFNVNYLKNSFLSFKNKPLIHNIHRILIQSIRKMYYIFFCELNKKAYENIYDIFYIIFRKIYYLMKECNYDNCIDENVLINIINVVFIKIKKFNCNIGYSIVKKIAYTAKKRCGLTNK